MSPEPINVLFCCLGNICRSPMAEAVFRHTVQKQRAEDCFGVIDSCGTADYHEGEEPHSTYVPSHTHTSTVKVCQENQVPINHIARAITQDDFYKFHYIFGMEYVNLSLTQHQ